MRFAFLLSPITALPGCHNEHKGGNQQKYDGYDKTYHGHVVDGHPAFNLSSQILFRIWRKEMVLCWLICIKGLYLGAE